MPSPAVVLYIVLVLAFFSLLQAGSLMLANRKLGDSMNLRRKTLADGVSPWLAEILLTRRFHDFEFLVQSSGVRYSSMEILTAMASTTLIVMIGANFAHYNAIYGLAAGIFLGVVVPVIVLLRMRRRRLAQFILQLPEAIDMLVRSLRAGHPIPLGIKIVANAMPNPIGGEFRIVFDTMSYGLDLKDALENLSSRVRVLEVKYMVAAIRIQYATGGNLAGVLSSLANVMRERVRLKMKVKALSAESRFSANVMIVMPFVLLGGMYYLRPELYADVPTSPTLQAIMEGAAFLLALGIVLMRRIVNIRV
jgi:tight adherence protein B